jgi:hypothetical protein
VAEQRRQHAPGETIVPTYRRSRLPGPLAGTAAARQLRHRLHWLRATALARQHNGRLPSDAPRLDFYPHRPQPRASIVRICRRLGLRIGFTPRAGGIAFAWDPGSWFDPHAAARLPADAINGRCLDVSKSTVDATWAELAGYGVTVDPLVTSGPIVVKSELNGTHDGRLLMGPLARREPGHVYQRLIDSRQDGRIHATRALVIAGTIPLAFEKWRPDPNWFHGGSVVQPARPAELWSADEIALIVRFCARIGLEYGEVDVLRDNGDGRIYLIDANRTPIRPIGLAERHDEHVYGVMSDAFAAFLEARSAA